LVEKNLTVDQIVNDVTVTSPVADGNPVENG